MSSGIWSRAMKGWLAGCGAATAVITGFAMAVLGVASGGDLSQLMAGSLALLFSALLIFVVTCVLTGIPAALVIWLSEKFAIRSFLFFGFAGAITGTLGDGLVEVLVGRWPSSSVWLFAVTGFVAGIVYWRVAGRHSGGAREVSGDPV